MTNEIPSENATQAHPAVDLETIVIDPDDVLEAMRRNKRDETKQRSHVLRVSPPFRGEQAASLHVSESHTYYPPEMGPKPLHLTPEAFIIGHSAGVQHSDWRDEWFYPIRHRVKSLFHDEVGAYDEHGEKRPLTDDEEDEWEEWWESAVELWEDRVRHALQNTDELTLTGNPNPNLEETTVTVRFETADD